MGRFKNISIIVSAFAMALAGSATVHAAIDTSGVVLVEGGGAFAPGNLAAAATAFAPDIENQDGCCGPPQPTGYSGAHTTTGVNNLVYGNSGAWLAGSPGSFVGLDLGGAFSVASVAYGRDNNNTGSNGGGFDDRQLGLVTLQYTTVPSPTYTTPAGSWTTIGTMNYTGPGNDPPNADRHRFDFAPVNNVTGLRLITANSGRGIDEFEVYSSGVAQPATSPPPGQVIYGPLTYTDGVPASQGGPYAFNATPRGISFTADTLSLSGARAHGLTYDTGFSTTLSEYVVTTTHVSGSDVIDRHGLLGYAVDGVGAMGLWIYRDGNDVRYGSILESGGEEQIQLNDVLEGADQVSGDGTSPLNAASTFEITMNIIDTGINATSMFDYTLTQGTNVWQFDVSFTDMLATGGTASTLIGMARNSGQGTGFAFYTFEDATVNYDNTIVTVATVIPEPGSFALAALGLLSLSLVGWRRRRKCGMWNAECGLTQQLQTQIPNL